MDLTPDPVRDDWDDVADWTPWRISPGPEGPVVEWVHTGGLAFDDPFLDETIRRALRRPFGLLCGARTALAAVPVDAARGPALPVAGVVLHLSRCGSTLAAQVLDALPEVLVVSEPAALDVALRLAAVGHPLGDGTVAGPEHVRGVVDALARPRHPAHRACVLKLDAWAVVDLPLVRAALPGVPWVFLHRDGAAVLASHRRVRGPHVHPGLLPGPWPAWDPGLPPGLAPDEHTARVLAALAEAALAHAGPDGLFVDHADLPAAVADVIAPHFGLAVDAAGRAAMDAAGRRDAKNPVLDYTAPAPAGPDLAAVAARWLDPVRRRLVEAGS